MDASRRTVIGLGGASLIAGLLSLVSTGRGEAAAETFPLRLSNAEWRRRLSPQAYRVLRQAGTEVPGSSALNREHRRGTFACAGCGNPLFRSVDKFDSGTGWPSFTRALPGRVGTRTDKSLLMIRTEVNCARCGGHLGHVFDDGPPPTGKRYCMNGVAMRFLPA